VTIYSAETLDLSRLAAPSLVDTNFEKIRAAQVAEFIRVWTLARQADPSLPAYDVQMLETDLPIVEAEAFSYGIMNFCQQVNDSADALRLAKAVGGDLEHLAATYHSTQRKVTIPANADTGAAAVYESDDELRSRAQLAPEALADLGLTPGGYMYKVRTAFTDKVKDVRPIRRGGGMVELRVLGRPETGDLVAVKNPDGSTTYTVDGRVSDGTVPETVVGDIIGAFNPEDASQSTDILTVYSSLVLPYTVDLTLVMRSGPDPEAVKGVAAPYIQALADSLHRIKSPVFMEAFSSAAHVGPVSTVRVNFPSSDMPAVPEATPFMTQFTLRTEVLS
jgi:phage-related baseplate assembly protein